MNSMTQGRLHANVDTKLDRKAGEQDTIMTLDGLWLAHWQSLSNAGRRSCLWLRLRCEPNQQMKKFPDHNRVLIS
jgi:hypothetical protein